MQHARLAARIVAVIALIITASCSSLTEPGVEYFLATIDGKAVPTAHPEQPGYEVIGGGFSNRRSDIREWIEVRCIVPKPANSTCTLTGTAVWERRGTYTGLGSRFYVADDVYYPMEFEGQDRATIRFGGAFEHAFYYTR
jgi:hypothetical protein